MRKEKKGHFPWFVVWWIVALIYLTMIAKEGAAAVAAFVLCAALGCVSFLRHKKAWSEAKAAAARRAEAIREREARNAEIALEQEARRAAAEQRRRETIAKKSAAFAAALDRIPLVDVVPAPMGSFVPDTELQPITFTNITKRTNIDGIFPLVVIDTETTGVEPEHDEIIEISAIKFGLDFRPIAAFTTLCKPHRHIPASASRVNNITDDMVVDCPYFEQVAQQFQDFISGCNVLGHNVKFDCRMINYSGVQFGAKTRFFDTWELSKAILTVPGDKVWSDEVGHSVPVERPDVKNRKLSTVAEHYGIYRDDAHRSLSDCLATAAVFRQFVKIRTVV